ncbi:enoyl-CoA hydratase [Ralstonia soli]|nr:enoyl-CoA hydratase [Ralstonia soli]
MSEVVLRKMIDRVGLIQINRPEALNALNDDVMDGIGAAVDGYERDDNIGCIVLTGNERAFAAGADVAYMKDFDFQEVYKGNFISRNWEKVREARKPVVAAVSGYALGGGCELAMMCDLIFASDTARFGQPEIKIGTMPGAGGTQRLPRLVGKAKAMDLCLTSRMVDAAEAERWGIVSRVYPCDRLLDETLEAAKLIASYSLPVVMMIKESINRAYESSLSDGLLFERRAFHSTFGLDDQKEGMSAFLSKRQPKFKHR